MFRRVFQRLEQPLVSIYRKLGDMQSPNLRGDREVENSWIAANMPDGPGEALDFGCGAGWLGLLAARRGFKVTAIDLQPVNWYYEHPHLRFIQGDVFELPLAQEHFDLIINCSAVEHVGLSGRYGISELRPDGDIEAMALLKSILKPGKVMLLTIPVGKDRVFAPLHRVYGEKRLPILLAGLDVLKKEFWLKDELNRWTRIEEPEALRKEPLEHCYGLGLFVLRK